MHACSTHVEYPSVDLGRPLGGGVVRVREEDEADGDGGEGQGDDKKDADSEGERGYLQGGNCFSKIQHSVYGLYRPSLSLPNIQF